MTYGLGHELKHAVINASASGDNTLVTAVAGQRIKVVSYVCIAANAVNATFKSGASTSISGALTLGTNSGVSCPNNCESVLMQTAVGEGLVLNLSGNVLVGGHLSYIAEA